MIGIPKPASSKGQRTKRHQAKLRAFRDAVWKRFGTHDDEVAMCRCGRFVARGAFDIFPAGEVHHLKPRSTSPEEKYNPANGVILCRDCHRAVTEHRISL